MIDKEQKFIDIHPILDYGKGTGKTYVCDSLATYKKVAEELNKIFGWNVTFDKVNENSGENISRKTSEDGVTND